MPAGCSSPTAICISMPEKRREKVQGGAGCREPRITRKTTRKMMHKTMRDTARQAM